MSPEIGLLPEPWAPFLGELDQMAIKPVDFHCIGGFVVTRRYGYVRETRDLDVLSVTPNTQRAAFVPMLLTDAALAVVIVNLAIYGLRLHRAKQRRAKQS